MAMPVDIDLSKFRIEIWSNVGVATEDHGCGFRSIGYFSDPVLAAAFGKKKGSYGEDAKIHPVHVLTDGTVGYILDDAPIRLADETAEKQKLIAEIRGKLSPEELALLESKK